MIIVANQRGGSGMLAKHLLSDENDHVEVHQLDGVIADDLNGALQEMYAASRATKCKKFMFSVSLSPPTESDCTDKDFEDAIKRIEDKLNLQGQAKAVVFHEKGNRPRHCHCVWSRINTDEMKAIKLNYYKKNVNTLSKDLFIEHGWTLPDGFKEGFSRDIRNHNLAEWQQAKRHDLSAKQIKARIHYCWKQSDNEKSFKSALEQEGFFLARGDRKNVHVAVDWQGEVYSIRGSTGENSKVVKAKLGQPDNLPTVEATQAIIQKQTSALHTRLQNELTRKHQTLLQPILKQKAELLKTQRIERQQQIEAHEKRQLSEQQARQAQYQRGFKGLWHLVTGRTHQQKQRHETEYQEGLERDKQEKYTLINNHLDAKKALHTNLDKDFMAYYKNKDTDQELKTSFTQSSKVKQTPSNSRELNL